MDDWQPFFQPTGKSVIPSTDLLSFIFDQKRYADDEPVNAPSQQYVAITYSMPDIR